MRHGLSFVFPFLFGFGARSDYPILDAGVLGFFFGYLLLRGVYEDQGEQTRQHGLGPRCPCHARASPNTRFAAYADYHGTASSCRCD